MMCIIRTTPLGAHASENIFSSNIRAEDVGRTLHHMYTFACKSEERAGISTGYECAHARKTHTLARIFIP